MTIEDLVPLTNGLTVIACGNTRVCDREGRNFRHRRVDDAIRPCPARTLGSVSSYRSDARVTSCFARKYSVENCVPSSSRLNPFS